MQKRFFVIAVFVFVCIIFLSSVDAKQRLAGSSSVFHQPSAKPFLQSLVETKETGFNERNNIFVKFPSNSDKRVRKSDLSKIMLVRNLLSQTLDKKLYQSPDLITLSCSGGDIFDKDRAMIQSLAELACLRNVQVPFLRTTGVGKSFVTGSFVKGITGMAVASGIFSTPKTDCNEDLKDVGFDVLQALLQSERALVYSELEISRCSNLNSARAQFSRGESHFAAMRFASAINSFEDAWRKTVSCVCSSII